MQARILQALKPTGFAVTVVGDDAQAIYGFRAAEVRNILDFPGQFEPRARVITLERNYRSTQPILAASNAVIGEARERYAKELWTERRSDERPLLVTVADETAQADYVCAEVLAAREIGTRLKDQAVLFRTAHHCGPWEIELTRRNIPFVKFGGLKFLEAAHVKDVLAVLRFAENPRDRLAGFRVLLLLPGIGPRTAEEVLTSLESGLDRGTGLAEVRVPQRARSTGTRSLNSSPTYAPGGPSGRPSSTPFASGTSRISSAFMRMPRCAAATCSSSGRLHSAFRRGSAS